MSKYDVIIVGAGHSGLVAGFYLARAGLKVLMLERSHQVGGTCITEEVFPGYRGSSIANSCHSLDPRIAGDMELEKHGLRLTHPDLNSLTLFSNGDALVMWPERERRRAEMERLAEPGDMQGFSDVMQFYQNVAKKMGVSFYDPAPSLEEVAARFVEPADKEAFNLVMFGSVADVLDRHLKSPWLKSFLAGTAMATNLVGPRTPGSGYILLQRPLQEESMRRSGVVFESNELMMKNASPIGGVGAVTQAMARANESLGVEIRLEAPVRELLCDNGKVKGVVLESGEEIEAARVLANINPKTVLTKLVPANQLPPEIEERARKLTMHGSSSKVHLALKGTPRFNRAGNDEENTQFLGTNFRVVPSIDVLQESYNEAAMGRWSPHVTISGVVSSAADPNMTPPGCHFMSLSVRGTPYHLSNGSWDDQREALGNAVVETLSRNIGNIKDIIEGISVYTPVDLERNYGMTEGNGAHGDIVPGRIFDARPMPGCANYTTPIEGLFMCGVGNWPGNFMSGLTGYNASRKMLGDFRPTH
ncbi:thiamine biosynthesis Thi4 protein [Ancylobacter novellus DSM 506]|uniref:Pyridine nucleotide-disulfide oxidoreductase domain-containing protein 2 n=1 Tax=Ancylobacter novellus (strain ATCC 8093 / DSM 506 / JCM 20403 / CCM 1077 / IAM 12100 / NBRC 12443 / NCIMB 10456) TaxID=639283 RepID=D7A6I1_ANCN5|nr:NAD(P)/FAD-dependent oxidoreductase [Ancylobacter novellus]ADH90179.1 thiamine biosynthesis Thi4 protein [Ancylobacter novellus DSM 506]